MICPFCSHDESIIVHTQKFSNIVRRNRACTNCGMSWRTFEDNPVCKECGNKDSDVTSSEKYEVTIRRTRKCPKCPLVWKTYESIIDEHSVVDFMPCTIIEEVYKRKRKYDDYAIRTKTQLPLSL